MRPKLILPLALSLVVALGVAACGGNDDGASGGVAGESETAAETEPVAAVQGLSGRQTEVILDEGFVGALTDLQVTPGPVGDATIEDGVAAFPITGGEVTYFDPDSDVRPYVQGLVKHDGSGLSLEAGGTTVELTDFDVDPATSVLTGNVSVDGEEAASGARLFILDGSTLEPLQVDESEGTAVLAGTTVRLTDDAAGLLNETFGIDALERGLVIGIARITINV